MSFPPADEFERARRRLAAVGAIASLLGHRARNRLTTVRAALELLQAGLERNMPPAYRTALLGEIDGLIGDFNLGMDMVRCDHGRPESLSATSAIVEAVESFRERTALANLTIETQVAAEADRIRADARLLRLVLLNLLRNAAEALGATFAPRVIIQTSAVAPFCLIEIADNGPGVPAGLVKKLFKEPVTDREGGTGLGLLLCHDAAMVMGGSIGYAAGAAGARFHFTVPLEA